MNQSEVSSYLMLRKSISRGYVSGQPEGICRQTRKIEQLKIISHEWIALEEIEWAAAWTCEGHCRTIVDSVYNMLFYLWGDPAFVASRPSGCKEPGKSSVIGVD